jgi:hypothetical protein
MPSYSWRANCCGDKVSVYRPLKNFEVAPSRQCPHCNSTDVECLVHQTAEQERLFYCNDCTGGPWDEQCTCKQGDWTRLLCAPVNRWRFCD